MSIERVPPKEPILDAAESSGGKLGLIARILRPLKAWREKRARKKAQEYVDKHWHDKLRVGEHEP